MAEDGAEEVFESEEPRLTNVSSLVMDLGRLAMNIDVLTCEEKVGKFCFWRNNGAVNILIIFRMFHSCLI